MKVCYGKIVDRLTSEVFVNDIEYLGTWDTGAMLCVMDDNKAKEMNLIPTEKVDCATPNGVFETNMYEIDLKIGDLFFKNIQVLGGNMDKEFLIGMNVINKGKMIVENEKETILSFEMYN
ncbi:MAG: hypothetical protein Ta2D_12190 [Rickettsiales bacterium]|nr:MAG: hypothetical protein Ta2D_12190 [Rickettsiales bacterium]